MSRKPTGRVWMGLAAAILIVAGAVPASADQRIVATVPFDFIAGESLMPAGDYVVTETDDRAVVSIANMDGQHFAFVLTIGASPNEVPEKPVLVFERFGGQRFLARIADASQGRDIPLTPATMERAIQLVAPALGQ